VCISLCTTFVHNTAQNSSDNFPSYPSIIIAQVLSTGGEGPPSQRDRQTQQGYRRCWAVVIYWLVICVVCFLLTYLKQVSTGNPVQILNHERMKKNYWKRIMGQEGSADHLRAIHNECGAQRSGHPRSVNTPLHLPYHNYTHIPVQMYTIKYSRRYMYLQ